MNGLTIPLRIDDIKVERSRAHSRDSGVYSMHIELHGFSFTGYFNDMPGYLTAVSEAAKFFMVKLGHISAEQAKLTREVRAS